jgi:chemotaxis protein CheD
MAEMLARHELPAPLPGFEAINRYWDPVHGIPAAKIMPGEYYVTAGDELVTTVLGSCVAACVRDRVFGIGGMNHFMLPVSADGKGWNGSGDILSTATRYGNYAMEHMINDILKHGGHKRHLEAKIFGGGRMMDSLSDVGARNIEFVREYLAIEGIPLTGESVGDIYPRKVIYIPATGKALVKRLKHLHNDTILRREADYRRDIARKPVAGSVELF